MSGRDQECVTGKGAAGTVRKIIRLQIILSVTTRFVTFLELLSVSSEDLSQLQYTLWCIKEALRLYPPVFNVFRELTEDVQLGEYLIPKGTHNSYNNYT